MLSGFQWKYACRAEKLFQRFTPATASIIGNHIGENVASTKPDVAILAGIIARFFRRIAHGPSFNASLYIDKQVLNPSFNDTIVVMMIEVKVDTNKLSYAYYQIKLRISAIF